MSTSTSVVARNRADQSTPRLKIQDFFKEVMSQAYDLPDSAIIETLCGKACTYGDYVFLGVSEVCEEFRQSDPYIFDKVGPIDIAKKVNNVFAEVRDQMRFKMVKRLFLHEAGILTFRLEGRWMAERITNMIINGMDIWAPTFFDKKARAVFIYPTNTLMMAANMGLLADSIHSVCIKDVIANILSYSGVDVCWQSFDSSALDVAHKLFTVKRGEIVGKRQPKTSYFRVEGVSDMYTNPADDFFTDIATLWYGVHKQEAELMVYMTPHRLIGYIQQCHDAATEQGLLPVDWEGTLICCGFQTFSGEQQEMLLLWERFSNSRDSHLYLEILDKAGYSVDTFFQSACKFSCLKRWRLAECTFKYEDLLVDIEGNTFGYILQTLSLVRSVITNSRRDSVKLRALSNGIERELGIQLVEFTDAVDSTCARLLPHILCEYLCDLSKLFTRYSELLDVSRPSSNMLGMCIATEAVMNKCCDLLGIKPGRDEWQALLISSYGKPEPRPTDYHIIPLSEAPRIEGLNSRFEIFSMTVRVACSSFDKGSVYGYVLVSDTYRSRADGWVGIDEKDNCSVSYFDRKWYESEEMENDSIISFGDPSCLHSIPFGSSVDVEVKLQATSKEKDRTYLLTNCKGTPPLSEFLSDSEVKYGTLRFEGIDGHVFLNYGLIKNAVDTKIEFKLRDVTAAAKVYGDIVAYYGDEVLGDRGIPGFYYALIFRANPDEYIGNEDRSMPLVKSTLAVPVNASLKIKALLKDVNSGVVIVEDSVEFPARLYDSVDVWNIGTILGMFELKVNWVPQFTSGSSQSRSSQHHNFWEPL